MKSIIYILTGVFFSVIDSNAQSWSLTGNTGTNTPTNFLGTTDAKALSFRVNNQQSGYIDFAATKANTLFGYQALKNNTSNDNAAFGYKASFSNTSGKNNTANGAYALYFNTTGISNIAMGIGALYKNVNQSNLVAIGDSALYNNNFDGTNGSTNTAIGSKSLYTNTSGSSNTGLGFRSLYSNVSGFSNVANGVNSLYLNSTGSYNTAAGTNALLSNTTGGNNAAYGAYTLYSNQSGNYSTAVGYSSLYHNTSSFMTAVGYGSLYSNTTGTFNTVTGAYSMYNSTTGYSNAAYGYSSLYSNTTGFYNTAIGTLALYSNTIGSNNTAVGYRSLYNSYFGNNTAVGYEALYTGYGGDNTAVGAYALLSSSGVSNTAVGSGAAETLYEGSYNTFLGWFAGTGGISEIYNSTALGYYTDVLEDNHVRIGDEAVNSIGGQVDWTSFSDERIKTDVKENVPGLSFIKLLKPVTYHFSLAKENELLGKKDTIEWKTKHDIEKINFTGLLAQQVDKAAQQINYDFSGVDKSKTVWGLRYAAFTVPLIKAVQELSKENDSLRSEIEDLKSEMNEIKSIIGLKQSTASSEQSAVIANATLEQNMPNPFSNTTTINYSLPKQYSSAQIMITDKTGKPIKQINISDNAKGSVQIDASMLSSGSYQYALIIDGRMISSKQMSCVK